MSEITKISSNESPEIRAKKIIRVGIVGIILNLLLVSGKLLVGILAGSIAIIIDAVNNLTDASSSIVTIVGTKVANKPADKDHPWGHGRAEYITAVIIAMIIMYAGITSLTESIQKLIHPIDPDYSTLTLIIVTMALGVKVFLGTYTLASGKKLKSTPLMNSGKDAFMDVAISVMTIVTVVIFKITGVTLEGWLGLAISIMIIKAGIDMLRETFSHILGEKVPKELATKIRKSAYTFSEIKGVYDLELHNYGPDSFSGTFHIEVPEDLTAMDLDILFKELRSKVYEDTGVVLTGIGIYACNTKDPLVIETKEKIDKICSLHPYISQTHGFYIDKNDKKIQLDLVVSFDAKDRQKVFDDTVEDLRKHFPDYTIIPTMDTDYEG